MRRVALTVAGLAAVASLAEGSVAVQPAVATPGFSLAVTPEGPGVVTFPGGPKKAGRTVGYWGWLAGHRTGSYRATCVWLATPTWPHSQHKQDNRFACTIFLNFVSTTPNKDGGGLVLQGLVRRPKTGETLFDYPSRRELAITGGTGEYQGAQGWADLQTAKSIRVEFDDLVP
jgi:hypothetical protein